MKLDKKKLGFRIGEARRSLGLTQAQLAERAGLDTIYISQIERGQRTMSLPSLFSVANALKSKAGSLLDEEGIDAEDALVNELRELLRGWNEEQRKAVLTALRLLKKV